MGILVETKRQATLFKQMDTLKNKKDIADLDPSSIPNYQGGKFLRGRKYSFSPHQNDK
jgi:hypothetical protein